jgi:hypothetical protein
MDEAGSSLAIAIFCANLGRAGHAEWPISRFETLFRFCDSPGEFPIGAAAQPAYLRATIGSQSVIPALGLARRA